MTHNIKRAYRFSLNVLLCGHIKFQCESMHLAIRYVALRYPLPRCNTNTK